MGAGLRGNVSSSTLAGTGLRINRGLVAVWGCSDSNGVKTNVFWVRSHSAVNVSAVSGVDAVRGGGTARVGPSGSGDGGNTRWTPLTNPRRRIFLIFSGAVSAVGTACNRSVRPCMRQSGQSISVTLTSRDPEAAGCFSSVRRETLDIRPSVGESTMHQALPVPD